MKKASITSIILLIKKEDDFMKKKTIGLLALLGILASCGGGVVGGGSSTPSFESSSQKEEQPSTSIISSSSFSSASSSSSSSSSTSSSIVLEDDYEKTSTLEQIKELAENVDKTPMFDNNTSTSYSVNRKNKIKTSLKEIDVTDPKNDPDFYENSDHLSSNMAVLTTSNEYIDVVKNIKDNTVDTVRMLNTWISYDQEGQIRMRLRYDQILDVLYIEQLQLGYQTSCYTIESKYNELGEISISAYETTYLENVVFEKSLKYEENKELKVVTKTKKAGLTEALSLTHSDLSLENPITTCLEVNRMDQGDRYSFSVYKNVFQEEKDGPGTFISSGYIVAELQEGNPMNPNEEADEILKNHYDSVAYNISNYLYVKDSTDMARIMVQDTYEGGVSYNISLYDLEGYSKITKEDNVYKVYVGDKIYQNQPDGQYGTDDIVEEENDDYYGFAYVSGFDNGASLYVNTTAKENSSMTKSQAVIDLLDKMGLRFKEEVIEGVKTIDNLDRKLTEYNFYGVSANTILLPSEIEKIYYQYRDNRIMTREEVEALTKDEFKLFQEQVDDESYFALCSNGVEGNFTFDYQTSVFDLSNISITIPQTSLFNRGEEYTLTAKLFNGDIMYDLDSKDVVYEGKETIINLSENVKLPSKLENGEYKVVVYLTPKNNNLCRMSNLYYPNTEAIDILYLVEEEDYLKLYRLIADEQGFKLLIQDDFNLSNYIDYNQSEEYFNINFEQVGVGLFDSIVLDESMRVVLNGYLYNEEKEILMSSKEFACGLGELSIKGEELDWSILEEGTFNIRFEFKILDKNNEEIYSKEEESFQTPGNETIEITKEDYVLTVSVDEETKEESLTYKKVEVIEPNPGEEEKPEEPHPLPNPDEEEKPIDPENPSEKDPTFEEGDKEGEEGTSNPKDEEKS